jgi:centractin
MGIHECLISSIVSSDLDIRKKLFSSIYLAGGSTLFEGFGDRLLIEISSHSQVPKDAKIKINAPPERKYTTWIGGSILASLGTFSTMWVSAAEYKEYGPSIIHKKTFV